VKYLIAQLHEQWQHASAHGPWGKKFEEKFSSFIGGGKAVTTSSCMASLHLASIHLELKPGDEVIVPAQTHVATVHAVELLGAKPTFVDCELETGNIDINKIEQAITKKTKAIYIVHFAGIPVEMDRLQALAKTYNIKIVEDCALAIGGYFKGKHVGLFGDIGCFSFYPVKHITTGEGGMLVSQHEDIASKIARFRAFNVDRTHTERQIPGFYDVTGVGLNYRMSEMQAALGCTQLEKVTKIMEKRKNNFYMLKKGLEKMSDVNVLDSNSSDIVNSHYCLVMILGKKWQHKRNEVVKELQEKGIGTSIYYPQPVPRMSYYSKRYEYDKNNFQNAEIISDYSIALPVGPHLNIEDMNYIVEAFENISREFKI